MNNTNEIIQVWIGDIRSDLPLSERVTPDSDEVLLALPARIESFSEGLLMNLLCQLFTEETEQSLPKRKWLEKVRRYFEINKANLWEISCRRFGTKENAQLTLERMLLFMSAYAYFLQDIKLYSAASNAYDIIKSKSPSNRWQMEGIEEFIESIIENPERYIGVGRGK